VKVSNVRNVKKVKAEPKELIRIVKKQCYHPGMHAWKKKTASISNHKADRAKVL